MRCLWLDEGGLRLRGDVPVPKPPSGEALIRVLRAGICNTDLEIVGGYSSHRGILGHEFVGEVEVGPGELTGRRVVGEINAVCGTCEACRRGHGGHCRQRTVLGIRGRHGAFAEYLTLPVANLHVVPEGLSLDEAVFTEPLAAALEIQEQVAVEPGQRVLVVGDGKLGQLVARSLLPLHCRLTVAGRHPEKLELLARRGAAILDREPPASSFDLAVECTGNPGGFAVARKALRPRGALVLKSTYAGLLAIDASSMVVDEITVIGSRCGPFPAALEQLRSGRVEVRDLVEARFPLAAGLEAIERSRERGTLKVILDVAEPG